MFVRRDDRQKPLQRPYTGPYKVLDKSDKTFLLDIGGRQEHVSIDRLKPAHVDDSEPVQVANPPRRGRPPSKASEPQPSRAKVSRSGRPLRPPRRFN